MLCAIVCNSIQQNLSVYIIYQRLYCKIRFVSAYKFNPCDCLLICWVITLVGYKYQNQIGLEIHTHNSSVHLLHLSLVSIDQKAKHFFTFSSEKYQWTSLNSTIRSPSLRNKKGLRFLVARIARFIEVRKYAKHVGARY